MSGGGTDRSAPQHPKGPNSLNLGALAQPADRRPHLGSLRASHKRSGGVSTRRSRRGAEVRYASPVAQPLHPRPCDNRSGQRGVTHLRSVQRVGTARNGLLARLAVPDAGRNTLDRVLAAEDARVGRVLRDLHLLDGLTQRRTIAHTVLTGDASLLGPLVHHGG